MDLKSQNIDILSLVGVNRLLSCIVKNKEDIIHNFLI